MQESRVQGTCIVHVVGGVVQKIQFIAYFIYYTYISFGTFMTIQFI